MSFQISAAPNPVQFGTVPVRISVVGASPNETLKLKITKPNGEASKLEVQVQEDGSISFPLFLASGVGLYKISNWTELGCATDTTTDEACHVIDLSIMATKCSQVSGERQLELTAQTQTAQEGIPITFWISGGEPNTVAVVNQTTSTGVTNITPVTLNSEGFAELSLVTLGLVNRFMATNGEKYSDVVGANVSPDLNSPALAPDLGVLKTNWRTFADTKQQGVSFPLALQLQNTGDSAIEVSIDSVTGELNQEVPVYMSYESIPSGGTREFTYYFSGTHQEQLAKAMSVEIKGSYGGEKFSTSTTVLIPPRKLSVGLQLTSILAKPSNIVLGQSTRIEIEVTNTGETDLVDVALSSVTLPDALGSMEFSGVSIPANESYKTSFTVVPQNVGIHVASIDGVNLTGNAHGQIVSGSQELNTTFKVTAS